MTCTHRPNCWYCLLPKGPSTLGASVDPGLVCKSWQHLRVLHRDLRLLNPDHRVSCHDLQMLQVLSRLTDSSWNSRMRLSCRALIDLVNLCCWLGDTCRSFTPSATCSALGRQCPFDIMFPNSKITSAMRA